MSTLNPYKAPAVKPTHNTSFQIVLEAKAAKEAASKKSSKKETK